MCSSAMLLNEIEKNSVKPFKVLIEGNIASGKSAFLDQLEKHGCLMDIFPEPLERWQNFEGVNFFDLYYKDPYEYGLTFQLLTTLTYLQRNVAASKKNNKPIHVFERSLDSARQVFLESLVSEQSVSFNSSRVMSKWCEFLNKSFDCKPDLIVYIRSSPEKILKRLKSRGRTEEREIDLSYLKEVHANYEGWIKCIVDTPVIILNGDQPMDKMQKEYDVCVTKILEHHLKKANKNTSKKV